MSKRFAGLIAGSVLLGQSRRISSIFVTMMWSLKAQPAADKFVPATPWMRTCRHFAVAPAFSITKLSMSPRWFSRRILWPCSAQKCGTSTMAAGSSHVIMIASPAAIGRMRLRSLSTGSGQSKPVASSSSVGLIRPVSTQSFRRREIDDENPVHHVVFFIQFEDAPRSLCTLLRASGSVRPALGDDSIIGAFRVVSRHDCRSLCNRSRKSEYLNPRSSAGEPVAPMPSQCRIEMRT